VASSSRWYGRSFEQLVARGRVGAWGISGIGVPTAILETIREDRLPQPSRPWPTCSAGRGLGIKVKAPAWTLQFCFLACDASPTLRWCKHCHGEQFSPRCARMRCRRLESSRSRPA